MLTCFDVAEYFLEKNDESAGDVISNLHLQKLVYYAQGFCLAMYGRPLFQEKIEAWQQGPVCPVLYNQYEPNEAFGIPEPEALDFSPFTAEDSALMDEVYSVFGQFSAWKLRDMTLEEAPWKNTPIGREISHTKMASFFKSRLDG